MESSSPAGIGHNAGTLADQLKIEFEDILFEVDTLANKANAAKAFADEHGLDSDDDIIPLVEVGKEATKLGSSLDRRKLDRTKPLRDDVETINTFFKTIITRVDRIKQAFAEKVGEYDKAKKERERREAAARAKLAAEEAERKMLEAESASNSVLGDVLLDEAVKAEQESQMATNAAIHAGTGPTRTDAGTVSSSTKWTFDIVDAEKIEIEKLRPYFTIPDLEKAIRAHVRMHRDTRPLAGVRIYPEAKTSFR